jgi:hypothetical protein
MAHQGYDLQLTRYDERGWRATFYTTGMEHSPTSATGTAWRGRRGGVPRVPRETHAAGRWLPRPEKKRERRANGQLPLPTPRSPASASATRVLPIDLKVGDRLVDETGEWEVVSGPYTLNAGKNPSVRVKKFGQPEVTEIRSWGAHERISVKRATTAEGKR